MRKNFSLLKLLGLHCCLHWSSFTTVTAMSQSTLSALKVQKHTTLHVPCTLSTNFMSYYKYFYYILKEQHTIVYTLGTR